MLDINQLQDYVNNELSQISFHKEPVKLYEPIDYSLAMGGKRIRPVLCLMAAQLFDGDIKKSLYPALALEVFHNFTLLHDDIMDNAEVRRNQPAVHKKWSSNAAILSGDAMLIKAYQFLSICNNDQLPELFALFNELAIGVCEGQQYDMDFETRMDVTADEYIEMIRLKTAILLAGSLKVGALLAKASKEDAECIYEFGLNIGLSFQLQDDYLDCFGDTKNFGKKIGGDILANKKTYLLINALELAQGEEKIELERWLSAVTYNEQEKINSVKELFVKLKVDELSQLKMKEYYQKAMENIQRVNVENKAKDELIRFAQNLMKRNN